MNKSPGVDVIAASITADGTIVLRSLSALHFLSGLGFWCNRSTEIGERLLLFPNLTLSSEIWRHRYIPSHLNNTHHNFDNTNLK